jgi:hypothetical protein
MTGKQKIQRWANFGVNALEASDEGECVMFWEHKRIVSSMQRKIDKLKVDLSIANSETTKLEGDLFTCQESLSHLQQSLQPALSGSLFSRVSRWLSELTGWSPRQR